ncbi:MAG: hypothetical protein KJZ96_06110 [Rhodocyclaceae bacterium]|nr:hypothetical protein [Rhodocyclaceae bacterium]
MNTDRAVWGIVGANLLTVGVAVLKDWGLVHLLWPFWIQSVVIGVFARRRMLALREFSTENFRINDQAVAATPETLRRTANFFALHYGFFHFVYFVFLLAFTFTTDPAGMIAVTNESTGEVSMVHMGHVHPLDWLIFLGLGLGFRASHGASHREHVENDLRRRPNLGTMMFLPYLRVLPMHLTIIGAVALGGSLGIWLFGLLKLAADVLMHKVEHRWLQSGLPKGLSGN